jgi:hypothetical protein
MKLTKVLVCGGRNYGFQPAQEKHIRQTLDDIHAHYGELMIIHGGAPGADTIAGLWADDVGQHSASVRPHWRTKGKSAGPIRNAAMLCLLPDLCVAFPGNKGTADMAAKAKQANVVTYEV